MAKGFVLIFIIIGFIGCAGRPSDKEIKESIGKYFFLCGEDTEVSVKILGIANEGKEVNVISEVSVAENEYNSLAGLAEKFNYDKSSKYKFTFKKYSDIGWRIDKRENLNMGDKDIYSSVEFISGFCEDLCIGKAKGSLSSLWGSLQVYYSDHKGKYPEKIDSLVPKYMNFIPKISLDAGKTFSSEVYYIKTLKGESLCKYVNNKGGWLYVADPKDPSYGSLAINSNKIVKGVPLCMYMDN